MLSFTSGRLSAAGALGFRINGGYLEICCPVHWTDINMLCDRMKGITAERSLK